MNEPDSPHRVGFIAALACVIYLLSPGPVVKYYTSTNQIPPSALVLIYWPLGKACDHIPWLQKAYESYFRMWGMP